VLPSLALPSAETPSAETPLRPAEVAELAIPADSRPPAERATEGSVARASAFTEDLIERGAPWSSRTSWPIVAAEGVAAVIVGLLFLFEPFGGSSLTLLLMGLILLVGALITTFQLSRHAVRPDLENLAAFRSGSGVTVGLVTIVATFVAASLDAVTAAMAVVVGIGFLVFGVAGIAGSIVRRRADAALPLIALVINGALALAGFVLLFAGAAGTSAVDSIFKLLGIVLIVAGLALGGYAYLLRQQVASGVRS
jgi:uncharacterized membrane protein HdeD (DUF308 family)